MDPIPSNPIQFQFSDPRQRKIYEELRDLIGNAPSAFFRDACWMMANPGPLETRAHLVAHCLREIEELFRMIFTPMIGSLTKNSRKQQIESIIKFLGLSGNELEITKRIWSDLYEKLSKYAHKRGVHIVWKEEEISELWQQALSLFEILLKEVRSRFLYWVNILDDLLKKSKSNPPTQEDIKKLTHSIPANLIIHRYFFDRLENPEWLEPLWKRGFFKHLPEPIHDDEQGTIRFPPWPEARYLARMAKYKAEVAAQIIQEMDDTENVSVQADLLDGMLNMPPKVSSRLVDKAEQWAKRPYWLLPIKLGELMEHWAKGGRTEEALRVARMLLEVIPEKRHIEAGVGKEYRFPPEPQARFDIWDYEEILKKHYPELVRAAGLPALELLCDLLERAIQFSRNSYDKEEFEDYSEIWRPAIKDHHQSQTIKDILVSAARDAAELIVRSGHETIEKVLQGLECRPWKIFRRIALHLLQVFQEQAGSLAARWLTDHALFQDLGHCYEYVMLLRARFRYLAPHEQAEILSWIDAGPDIDEFKRRQEAVTGLPPSDEEIIQYREMWQRNWLARIGPENIPGEWRERYKQLVRKYGEPEHIDFLVYRESRWVGPKSPKSADELKAMPIEEIVKFLNTWEPPEGVFSEPSPEGLGSVLSYLVAEDPASFAREAKLFQGLDPTYVRAVLDGFKDALKQGKAFDWGQVLELCLWVMSKPREIPGRRAKRIQADPDWGWTRWVITDLLSDGLDDTPRSIPIYFREKVWSILKSLTEDPDPTPEHEERYGGSNMDPATLAINTVRGKAMHSVVRYALWVRRHMEGQIDADELPCRSFDEMPEVREVLDDHLDEEKDPSLAIRAVYGEWFPWLVLLDPEWARNNLDRIFPIRQGKEAFFAASWNAYITFCRPYDFVLDILRGRYHYAVARIGCRCEYSPGLAEPDEKLAEHLMIFYWRGKLSLDDPLLIAFWEKAPDMLRAHSLQFIGLALEQTPGDISAEILNRLKQLWESRLHTAKKAPQALDFKNEIGAFGWWFVSEKFDMDWAIAQLLESLLLVRQTKPNHMVLEHLLKTVETHPLESVQCLRIIAEGDREGWAISVNRDNIRKILEVALRNPSAREEAERTIHYLGSQGFLEYRNLLQD